MEFAKMKDARPRRASSGSNDFRMRRQNSDSSIPAWHAILLIVPVETIELRPWNGTVIIMKPSSMQTPTNPRPRRESLPCTPQASLLQKHIQEETELPPNIRSPAVRIYEIWLLFPTWHFRPAAQYIPQFHSPCPALSTKHCAAGRAYPSPTVKDHLSTMEL